MCANKEQKTKQTAVCAALSYYLSAVAAKKDCQQDFDNSIFWKPSESARCVKCRIVFFVVRKESFVVGWCMMTGGLFKSSLHRSKDQVFTVYFLRVAVCHLSVRTSV